jgi:membrane-associated phospholipid phosphatase
VALLALVAATSVTALAACGSDDGDSSGTPGGEPSAGHWRTWVIRSPTEVGVPPPPRPGSPEARADAAALRRLTSERTPSARAAVRRFDEDPAVKPWIDVSLELVSTRPKDPPAASRAYALVSVAMYDAAVAAWHWKYVYRRKPPEGIRRLVRPGPDPSYPSEHAAIAGAASRVLAYAFPEYPAPRLDQMADRAARSRVVAGASSPSGARAGLALGRAVAAAVVRRARRDGFDRKWDGKRPRGRGYWEPPPGSLARPVQPLAGTWRTWVMESGRQFRPGPPPRFGGPKFVAEAREVMRVRRKLTPRQKRTATFWAGGEGTPLPPGIWNQVALEYVGREHLSLPKATRVLALLNVAMADAGVAAWDAKYTYWNPRPENGIRDLGLDRHWEPYLDTPFFPAYVSGHATYSAAAGEVLAYLFPRDADLWRAKAREAGISRIYGGIHWPSDNAVGTDMGKKIGRLVVEHAERDGAGR